MSNFRIYIVILSTISLSKGLCTKYRKHWQYFFSHKLPFVCALTHFDIIKYNSMAKLSVCYFHTWKHTQSFWYLLQIFVPAHVENCSTHYFHDIPIYPIANHNLEAHKSWRKEKNVLANCSMFFYENPSSFNFKAS